MTIEYDFQDNNQEVIIHSDYDWNNNYDFRLMLEGSGDIFRELSENPNFFSISYIMEKIDRITKFYNERDRLFEHMTEEHYSDKIIKAVKNSKYDLAYYDNHSKFMELEKLWKEQPISKTSNTELQKLAVKLNLALLKNEDKKVRSYLKLIEKKARIIAKKRDR